MIQKETIVVIKVESGFEIDLGGKIGFVDWLDMRMGKQEVLWMTEVTMDDYAIQ